jgi:L-fuconolactonase
MQRRELLKLGAAIAGGWATSRVAEAFPRPIPVIDTHIHLFDPGRPGACPGRRRPTPRSTSCAARALCPSIARPFGVVGAIVIEASNLASDNDWVLNVAANHPIIVGMVGDLIPGTPGYQKTWTGCTRTLSFWAYGTAIYGTGTWPSTQKPEFLPGLKMLAERGLVLDSANPDLSLIRAIAGVADHIPELRIVIDHLPSARCPPKQPHAMSIGRCCGTWRKTKTSSSSFLK